MRGTQITLFVLALLVLGTQTFRHVYVKWIEPTDSVLDAYRPPIEEEIAASEDLDTLVALYDKAWKNVQAYEESASNDEIEQATMMGLEPYESERAARHAIERWEAQSQSIFQLRFYWLVGLLSIIGGLIAYTRVNRWLGMVGLITGFLEMTVWTSPLWHAWGPQAQFERLLDQKLILSLVSVALLVGLWLWSARRTARKTAAFVS